MQRKWNDNPWTSAFPSLDDWPSNNITPTMIIGANQFNYSEDFISYREKVVTFWIAGPYLFIGNQIVSIYERSKMDARDWFELIWEKEGKGGPLT